MLRIKVDLISARSGKTTALAEMHVCNDGTGTAKSRNYDVRVANKRDVGNVQKIAAKPQRRGYVQNHPAASVSVWTLVKKALEAAGY